jgi:hypothetical protein
VKKHLRRENPRRNLIFRKRQVRGRGLGHNNKERYQIHRKVQTKTLMTSQKVCYQESKKK